jgi:hypothetical protein
MSLIPAAANNVTYVARDDLQTLFGEDMAERSLKCAV